MSLEISFGISSIIMSPQAAPIQVRQSLCSLSVPMAEHDRTVRTYGWIPGPS